VNDTLRTLTFRLHLRRDCGEASVNTKPTTVRWILTRVSRVCGYGAARFVPLAPTPAAREPLTVPEEATLSERIKARATVLEFVSQYVGLKPTASGAIGLCPFHDDNHLSFGINVEGSYWHCFAGCGGVGDRPADHNLGCLGTFVPAHPKLKAHLICQCRKAIVDVRNPCLDPLLPSMHISCIPFIILPVCPKLAKDDRIQIDFTQL